MSPSTKPLSYQGTLIEDIRVRFEAGADRRGHGHAPAQEVLSKVLDTDDGARRLGEVALVPHSSPISQSGLLFYNTLFDENAASHIALGQAYSKCFLDGDTLTPRPSSRARGANSQPDPHRLDDRLGRDRHRRHRHGRRPEPLMRKGEWVPRQTGRRCPAPPCLRAARAPHRQRPP